MGSGIAGAIFGSGWLFWIDAVVCSAVKVSFLQYLPRIFASIAALMFNCVDRNDLGYDYYSPYGETKWSWVSRQMHSQKKGPSVWTGVAGVLQYVFAWISGLVYSTHHSEE